MDWLGFPTERHDVATEMVLVVYVDNSIVSIEGQRAKCRGQRRGTGTDAQEEGIRDVSSRMAVRGLHELACPKDRQSDTRSSLGRGHRPMTLSWARARAQGYESRVFDAVPADDRGRLIMGLRCSSCWAGPGPPRVIA